MIDSYIAFLTNQLSMEFEIRKKYSDIETIFDIVHYPTRESFIRDRKMFVSKILQCYINTFLQCPHDNDYKIDSLLLFMKHIEYITHSNASLYKKYYINCNIYETYYVFEYNSNKHYEYFLSHFFSYTAIQGTAT